MQESTWVGITSMRSQAGNSLILPFTLMHGVVLVIIAFAGDALGDSSVQPADAGSLAFRKWLIERGTMYGTVYETD